MKAVVVFLFAVALGVAKPVSVEVVQKLQKLSDECSTDSGLKTPEVMKAIQDEASVDPKVKEHVLCFQQKLGVLNKDGEIQKDVLTVNLSKYFEDEAKAKDIVGKCANGKSSPQDTALALAKCIEQNRGSK